MPPDGQLAGQPMAGAGRGALGLFGLVATRHGQPRIVGGYDRLSTVAQPELAPDRRDSSTTVLDFDFDYDHRQAITGQRTKWIMSRGSIG